MNDQTGFWNERFAKEGFMYGKEPNRFIAEQIGRLPKGANVLCLAEGEGRNAVYLAKEGYRVSALDASDIGLAKCALWANQEGVDVALVCTDLHHWEPDERYDAIIASFMHLPEPLRSRTFSRALSALSPQGYLIMEFFSKEQMLHNYPSGGPKDLDLLYSVEELRAIFDRPDAEIIRLAHEEDDLQEGWGHQGPASLIRLIIQKKGEI